MKLEGNLVQFKTILSKTAIVRLRLLKTTFFSNFNQRNYLIIICEVKSALDELLIRN